MLTQDDILNIINEEFERDYELETPWDQVLMEEVLYPSIAATGTGHRAARGAAVRATLLNAELGSDNDDSDFECVPHPSRIQSEPVAREVQGSRKSLLPDLGP